MSINPVPAPAPPPTAQENLRTEYSAVSNYHSALLQVRFAGAGLYFAGLSLFAIQLENKTVAFVRVCSVVVIILTIFMGFLDLRTRNLMEFSIQHAMKIEPLLPVTGTQERFFGAMNKQTGIRHTWIIMAIYATGIGASIAAFVFADKITKLTP